MSFLLLCGLAVAGYAAWNAFTGNSSGSVPAHAPVPAPAPRPSPPRSTGTSSQNAGSRANASHSPAGGGWLAECGGNTPAGGCTTVYDREGNPLQLTESDERASGGEGTVYRFPGQDAFVIKLYKRDIVENPAKQQAVANRLNDMLAIEELKMNRDIAWPQLPVFDASRRVVGFAMWAVDGKSFRALQGPTQIKRCFPGWNRRDLALVAMDFLDKMQLLADHGVLVNDFNPANFIVGKDHKVRLIDCDSFQVPATNGGSPHVATSYFSSHVAPEILRDPSLLNRPRGPEQSRFGAAILVFQLLMCGLHPYSHKAGGMPEENLKSGKCPLGQASGCSIPTGWYNLVSYLPYTTLEKFIQMFRNGHGDPSARPTLAEFKGEVRKFLAIMDKDPIRKSLAPASPKSKSNHARNTFAA